MIVKELISLLEILPEEQKNLEIYCASEDDKLVEIYPPFLTKAYNEHQIIALWENI